jgi:hypothetical protein
LTLPFRTSARLAEAPRSPYLPRRDPNRPQSPPYPDALPRALDLRAPWIAPAALALALASLALNAALLWRLREPERLAAPMVERVLSRLAEDDAVLRYQVRVAAGTPLHFDVPIDERYTLKLRTTLPIDTNVRVPLRTPLGDRTVTVPIKTSIPIRTDIPLHITDTFRLRTQTQAEYVVPLEVRIRDLPLDQIRRALEP